MRFASLLLFTILLIVSSVRGSDYSSATRPAEACPKENCLTRNKCELTSNGPVCANKGHTCCSVVKDEFRTHCRHHGGECMKTCTPVLQRSTIDCPGQVCCVLV